MLRVVVRAGMTHDMADLFLGDLRKQTAELESLDEPLPGLCGAGRGVVQALGLAVVGIRVDTGSFLAIVGAAALAGTLATLSGRARCSFPWLSSSSCWGW